MPDNLLSAMDGRSDHHGEDRSAVIFRSLERYLSIVNRSKVEMSKQFTDKECGLILDACNGIAFYDTVNIQLMPASVDDAIEMDGLDQKWGVDGKGLMHKLNALGYAERVAMVDAIQLWWNRVSAGEQPQWGDLLKVAAFDKGTGIIL